MNGFRQLMGRHSDIALVALVLGGLTLLFAPIPSGLLDVLILGNVSFALLLLLLTFYMQRPVEFSTFPSLLLIATLCRLSLNVAATRLILTDADAGKVIQAVGSYVVSGNYVIGLIVFLILVVVQYVVVTSGAQRVSEVAARFTLDSMPGQQMSIDADLNMGFIDQAEAQRRRRNLEKQATFYGAMDGASKFVKGDAVAGIMILLINIVGGLVIGVMQQGMPWGEALHTFTLLTVGDGIVTQIPALVIAVGTGIIVTRSAADTNLSAEVLKQLLSFPKAIVLVMLAIAVIGTLPGIPALPVLLMLALLLFVVFAARWLRPQGGEPETADAPETPDAPTGPLPSVLPVRVRVASDLAGLADGAQSLLLQRVASFRTQLAGELGLVLPPVKFDVEVALAPHAYEISVYGIVCGKGEILEGHTLAIHASGDTSQIPGYETREPTYGLPAVWISDGEKERARAARFTLVDPATVFITHFSETMRGRCADLLTRAETEKLLARVREAQPGLVEEVVPTTLSVVDIQKVLQNLLREKVSILHMEAIVETLADVGRNSKDALLLTEAVRQRLAAAICQQLMGDAPALQVLTIDPALEAQLRSVLVASAAGTQGLAPKAVEQLLARVAGQSEQMMRKNLLPVLLCAQDLRRHLRHLTERAVPHMRVLAVTEVPGHIPLKAFGSISLASAEVAPNPSP